MNTITTALKEGGIKLPPLNKRVWLWLHDHKGKTAREIADALGVELGDVSSTLGAMAKRNMVSGTKEYKQGSNTQVTRYATIGRVFELKPMPKAVPTPDPAPEDVTPPAPVAPASLLDTLSVKEAHALYLELKKMFGGAS